jgi:hypothetical protein
VVLDSTTLRITTDWYEKSPLFTVRLSTRIVKTAVKVAVVVGTILAAINHGDSIVGGTMESGDWLRVGLTYLVPYSVSRYSAVKVLQRAADS